MRFYISCQNKMKYLVNYWFFDNSINTFICRITRGIILRKENHSIIIPLKKNNFNTQNSFEAFRYGVINNYHPWYLCNACKRATNSSTRYWEHLRRNDILVIFSCSRRMQQIRMNYQSIPLRNEYTRGIKRINTRDELLGKSAKRLRNLSEQDSKKRKRLSLNRHVGMRWNAIELQLRLMRHRNISVLIKIFEPISWN